MKTLTSVSAEPKSPIAPAGSLSFRASRAEFKLSVRSPKSDGDDLNNGDNVRGGGTGGDDTIDSGDGDDQNVGDNREGAGPVVRRWHWLRTRTILNLGPTRNATTPSCSVTTRAALNARWARMFDV
jgi:hypothetical protein